MVKTSYLYNSSLFGEMCIYYIFYLSFFIFLFLSLSWNSYNQDKLTIYFNILQSYYVLIKLLVFFQRSEADLQCLFVSMIVCNAFDLFVFVNSTNYRWHVLRFTSGIKKGKASPIMIKNVLLSCLIYLWLFLVGRINHLKYKHIF